MYVYINIYIYMLLGIYIYIYIYIDLCVLYVYRIWHPQCFERIVLNLFLPSHESNSMV